MLTPPRTLAHTKAELEELDDGIERKTTHALDAAASLVYDKRLDITIHHDLDEQSLWWRRLWFYGDYGILKALPLPYGSIDWILRMLGLVYPLLMFFLEGPNATFPLSVTVIEFTVLFLLGIGEC